MAERKSVKEILEAARRAGAAKPAEEAPAPAEEAAPEPAAAAPEPVEDAASAAEPEAPAAPAPEPAKPLGRPMTLAEKLAAARAGGAVKPAAAAPAPKPAAAPPAVEAPAGPPAVEEPAAPPAPAAPAPTPSTLGRPLTLAEKLAAARGGAKPAAAPGAKPAAAKAPGAAPAAKAAPGAARALPPLEKMTDPKDLAEAARQAGAKAKAAGAKGAEAPAAKPAKHAAKKAEVQAVPPKPSKAVASAAPTTMDRRRFLAGVSVTAWVIAGWVTFTAGLAALTAACGRFMFPNVLAEPPSTIKVGVPSNFEPEEVSERWKAEWGFWIVRSTRYNGQDIVYAIQSVCTHLGCPPNWLAGEQKFKCPCHGSGFYISGINFEGPAPRPLERFKVTLADDGQILVDKSQKFQEEMGQWADPDSFVPV